jgi:hypothetical protein
MKRSIALGGVAAGAGLLVFGVQKMMSKPKASSTNLSGGSKGKLSKKSFILPLSTAW